MQIRVLDPQNEDFAWAPEVETMLLDVPDEDFYNDQDVAVRAALQDELAKIAEAPCNLCGYYPGDGHNWEAHSAEMKAEEISQYEMEPPEMEWEDDAYEMDEG